MERFFYAFSCNKFDVVWLLFFSPRYFASLASSTNGILMLNTSSISAASDFNAAMEAAPVAAETVALVEIEVVSQKVSEVSRQEKVNLTGQIGTFGKHDLMIP